MSVLKTFTVTGHIASAFVARFFMHQSIPAAPSTPPGYCRAFARLVSLGGGAFANFVLPGGWAFANPRGHF